MSTASPAQSDRRPTVDGLIDQRIEEARRALWWSELVRAVLTTVIGAMACLLLWLIVDHWIYSPNMMTRVVCFVVALASVGFVIVRRTLPLLTQNITTEYAAWALEQDSPDYRQQLTTYVTLKNEAPAGVRARVFRAIGSRAASLLKAHDTLPREATGTFLWWIATAAIFAVLAAYVVASPKSSLDSTKRLIAPLASIEPAKRVHISNVVPGDTQALAGRRVEISAAVHGLFGDESVSCRIASGAGERTQIMNFDPSSERHQCQLDISLTATENVRYWIEAGDATAGPFKISVQNAPVVAIERIRYQPPAYTGSSARTTSSPAIHAIDATQIQIHASVNRAVERAEIQLNCKPIGKDMRPIGGTVKMQIAEEGSTLVGTLTLRSAVGRPNAVEPENYRVRVWDSNGQSNPDPIIYPIKVIPDLPPDVAIVVPRKSPTEIPLDGQQIIEVHAMDPDYELDRVHLTMVRGIQTLGEPTIFRRENNGRGNQVAVYRFRPIGHQLQVGDTVRITATAIDNRTIPSDPSIQANRSTTDPVELRIIDNDPDLPVDPTDNDGLSKPDHHPPTDVKESASTDGQSSNGGSASGSEAADSQAQGESSGDGQSGSGQSSQDSAGEDSSDQNSGSGDGQSSESTDSSTAQNQNVENQGGSGETSMQPGQQGNQTKGENDAGDSSSDNQQPQGKNGDDQNSVNPQTGEQNGGDQNASNQGTRKQGTDNQPDATDPSKASQQPESSDNQNTSANGESDQDASPNGGTTGNQNQSSGSDSSSKQEPKESGHQDAPNLDQTPENVSGDEQSGESSQGGDPSKSAEPTADSDTPATPPEHDGEAFERIKDYLERMKNENGGSGSSGQPDQPNTPQSSDQNLDSTSQANDASSNNEAATGSSEDHADGKGSQEQHDDGQNSGESSTEDGSSNPDESGSEAGSEQKGSEPNTGDSADGDQKDSESEDAQGESDQTPEKSSSDGDSGSNNQQTNPADRPSNADPNSPPENSGSESQGENPSQGSPSSPSPSQPSTPRPSGQPASSNQSTSGNNTGSGPLDGSNHDDPPPPPDLEYAKQATDMVLDYLNENRDQVDSDLLEELNWSADDLERFRKRWSDVGDIDQPAIDSNRKQDLEDALRSLGLQPSGSPRRSAPAAGDRMRRLRDSGNRRRVPASLRDALDAFKRR